MTDSITENAWDHRARRAARRVGLIARKSRKFNFRGFRLLTPDNIVVLGERCDLTAEEVIAFCRRQGLDQGHRRARA